MLVPDRMPSLVADMNYDGVVTISDVGLWVKWLVDYPGDFLILAMIGTDLGNFLEVSSSDYGGFFSGAVAVFIMITLFITIFFNEF